MYEGHNIIQSKPNKYTLKIIRLTGLLARKAEARNVYKIFLGLTEGKRVGGIAVGLGTALQAGRSRFRFPIATLVFSLT
jgi:hypothetical protein